MPHFVAKINAKNNQLINLYVLNLHKYINILQYKKAQLDFKYWLIPTYNLKGYDTSSEQFALRFFDIRLILAFLMMRQCFTGGGYGNTRLFTQVTCKLFLGGAAYVRFLIKGRVRCQCKNFGNCFSIMNLYTSPMSNY